jgi:hypothetical protein
LANKVDAPEEIARIRRRLADMDAERMALARQLKTLEQRLISDHQAAERTAFPGASVTNSSSSAEKIGLFRRLFAGRPDGFSGSMGKQKGRTLGIFAGVLQ